MCCVGLNDLYQQSGFANLSAEIYFLSLAAVSCQLYNVQFSTGISCAKFAKKALRQTHVCDPLLMLTN
jgi:hypothetical protein